MFEAFSTISTKIPPRGTDAGPPFNPLWANGPSVAQLHAQLHVPQLPVDCPPVPQVHVPQLLIVPLSHSCTSHMDCLLQTSRTGPSRKGHWPKGAKGGSGVGPPRGYFGRNRRKWLETAQPMRQKAIQSLLSRFRWSPGPSIFDGFLADLNRALSALFFKIRVSKI